MKEEKDVLVFISYSEIRDRENISYEEFKELDRYNPNKILSIAEKIAEDKLKSASISTKLTSDFWDDEGIYFANFYLRDTTLSDALKDDSCIKL